MKRDGKHQINSIRASFKTVFFYVLCHRLQKRMSMSTNRRSWKKCATPSSPSSIRALVTCQVECRVECLGDFLEGQEVVPPLVLPLRKWTKLDTRTFRLTHRQKSTQNMIYVNLLHLKQASYQLILVRCARWDQLLACEQNNMALTKNSISILTYLSIMFLNL